MPWDDAASFVSRIRACVDAFDGEGAAEICGALRDRLYATDDVFPPGDAARILGTLRRKRYFDLLEKTADAFIRSGQDAFQVRRQYAQAMLDQGHVSAAVPFLEALAADARDTDPGEHLEARGLLGRAFKQLYVDSGGGTSRARRDLRQAVRWYLDVFAADESQLWHGINVVALLCRAHRDGVDIDGVAEPLAEARRYAGRILQAVEDKWDAGEATMWDCGTAAEACVALDCDEDALRWLGRYTQPQADAFELASTRRQLVEVWRLDPETSDLVALLQAELLKREGSQLEVTPGELFKPTAPAKPELLEKVLGKTRYVSLKDMYRAFSRARAVARIEDRPDHGIGTGFLLRGADLHESLGNDLLLLTNAHVVSDDLEAADPPPLLPDDATVTFEVLRGEPNRRYEFAIAELLWTSPPGELDATLVRLDAAVDEVEPCPIHSRLPLRDGEQRVYVIGHPKGGTLSFSIQDNVLLDHEGPPDGEPKKPGVVHLHYRAPTEGGSSGSPVFNRQWKLIGLHHAGSTDLPRLNKKAGSYPANEGIWIQSIIEAMKIRPPKTA